MKIYFFSLVIIIMFSLPGQTLSGTLGDFDSDGKIDLKEAIYALQVVAGIKQQVSPSNLVGSWLYNPGALADSAVLTIIDDSNYMFAVDGDPDDGGRRGMERGTYTWNSSTGDFTATAISQTAGDWGISYFHPETVTIDENILNFTNNVEGLITFSRVAPNVTLGMDSCSQAYIVFSSSACQNEALAAFEAEDICTGQCGMVQTCLDDCEETLWNTMTSCHAGWPQLFDHGGDVNEGVCGQCYLDCDDAFNACLDVNNTVAACLDNLTTCAAECR